VCADAAGAPVDQHQLPRCQVRRHHQVRPHRARDFGQCGSMVQGHRVRNRHYLPGGDGDELRITPARQQSTDLLPHGPLGYAFANRGDGAGHLEAQDVAGSGRGRILAGRLQQVGPIDSSGAHLDEHFAVASGDIGDFLPDELISGSGHDRAHLINGTCLRKQSGNSLPSNDDGIYYCEMEGIIAGRTASDMPGLDIAEQRSWQNFLDSALRLYATLNRSLVDAHQLTLNDVRLLDILEKSASGSARMGDLADGLMSLPSRVTRQIRRLELQGLVQRGASPDDGRGVLATITDEGRVAVRKAMLTYGEGVRAHFLGRLSRPQIAAMGENCRRISVALKSGTPPAKLGRV
jgi:DNA-binding MarR family transcriptional regulator